MQGIVNSVGDVIRNLLPRGSRFGGKSISWLRVPIWAPDVFAVTATIAQLSSCYAEPGIALSRSVKERRQKRERAKVARTIGARWAHGSSIPQLVQSLWSDLVKHESDLLCCGAGKGNEWKRAALSLLAISDEACAGVGYMPLKDDGLANFAWSELIKQRYGKSVLQLPNSLTHMVPADVACVLPKALTPDVGCTLRSLTHHIALLTSLGVVQAEWSIHSAETSSKGDKKNSSEREDHSLNLLLIPFPYVVHATDFHVSREPERNADGYFSLSQGWLKSNRTPISVVQLTRFVLDLIGSAERDVGKVHGVVFPEAALTQKLALGLANSLSKRTKNLELIVCGTMRSTAAGKRNEAVILRLEGRSVVANFVQSKHHRWRLNARQIRQYQLGSVLDPEHVWWEDIDLHDRTIRFGVNRHEAVIAALVCEDLARYDPVLPVITSVGPSLVIALLMDGPQLEARWSGRYATVLAEDPGSSVLTLTSVGMVERSRPPGREVRRVVGLWKDREGAATELVLPVDSHGIVLSLTSRNCEQVTLDGRRDDGTVVEYRLSGTRSAQLSNPPKWLERGRAND